MLYFKTYRFDELSTARLYDILALRAEVFIVEQTSPYLDLDGLDQKALHFCMTENETLIGYARIFAPGIKFAEASIGRIVIAPNYRGQALGREIVQRSINEVQNRFGSISIRIEAQYHLRDFYGSLGFAIDSEIYDWGGIEHVKMVRL